MAELFFAFLCCFQILTFTSSVPVKLEPDYDYDDYSDIYSYYDENESIIGTLRSYDVMCKENSVQIDLDFGENFSGYIYPSGMLSSCKLFNGNGNINASIEIPKNHCGYEALFKGNEKQFLVIQWDPILIQDYDIEIPVKCDRDSYGQFRNSTPQAALILLKENVTLVSWKDLEPTSVNLLPHETVFVYFVIKSASPFNCATVRSCFAQSFVNGEKNEVRNVLKLVDHDCSLQEEIISDIVSMSSASAVNSAIKTAVLKVNKLALTNSSLLQCQIEVVYSSCSQVVPSCDEIKTQVDGSSALMNDEHKTAAVVEATTYLHF